MADDIAHLQRRRHRPGLCDVVRQLDVRLQHDVDLARKMRREIKVLRVLLLPLTAAAAQVATATALAAAVTLVAAAVIAAVAAGAATAAATSLAVITPATPAPAAIVAWRELGARDNHHQHGHRHVQSTSHASEIPHPSVE